MQPFKLGNSSFGVDKKPLLIAEIGSNHNQDLGTALSLIKASADCERLVLTTTKISELR